MYGSDIQIVPSTELRNNYSKVHQMSESSGLPVFITKNGYADGVFFSMGAFAKFEKEIMARRIKEDLEAMCKGEGMNADDLIRSLKEEYGI